MAEWYRKPLTSLARVRDGARQSAVRRVAGGSWYFVLTIATTGLFAWVPFLHAARRLGVQRLRRTAAVYGMLGIGLMSFNGALPRDQHGVLIGTTAQVEGGVVGGLALAVMVIALVQLWSVRKRVYGRPYGTVGDAAGSSTQADADPAVAEALAARTRRQVARDLAARDPLLAHDLRIGRPDLPRKYDDGGLVDLNSAPADVIARACGVDTASADKIVTARDTRDGAFAAVDEVFLVAELAPATWDKIRDKAILIAV